MSPYLGMLDWEGGVLSGHRRRVLKHRSWRRVVGCNGLSFMPGSLWQDRLFVRSELFRHWHDGHPLSSSEARRGWLG